jgi:hypothetical protein
LFTEGIILYISPFYFKNGNTSKNKYFIVLKIVDRQLVIASLPTRSNKAPALIQTEHGCNNDSERCFNCYAFQAGRPIAENGFSFPINTFVYGNEVEDYSLETLQLNYRIEGVDYEIMGSLTKKEYADLCACLKQSTSIRRGIKKHL